MKKTLQLLALAAVLPTAGSAQISLVSPVPQQITRPADKPTLSDAPQKWHIVCEDARRESLGVVTASQKLDADDSGYILTLGVKGDKCVKALQKQLPATAEGYVLKISEKEAIVCGVDEQGLFYGVQTLLQSMEEGRLETCTVVDFPDVPFRGTVEGFYGTPWSHTARLSQLDFYGRHKMNVYIYGPKDDPWHRDHWRVPYPEEEGQRISQLAEHAKACGVNFTWAIHPGVDIKWNQDDRDALVHKLELMYALGVRSFAVFFDDIWGEGTKADKQAELLNYVDDQFIKQHADVAPLVMCPTEYNRAWVNEQKGYLRTLGETLHPSIQIMWTGNSVVHCIDRESMEWVNARIQRKAYIWWNYPVSDYVRDHLLLGPVYGNDTDINSLYAGFVSNPMEHAEASKIALYGIADYTWHGETFNPWRTWDAALRELMPQNAMALRLFAEQCQEPGPNGHGFKRAEWREGTNLAKAASDGNPVAIAELLGHCGRLRDAIQQLLASTENPALIQEIRPWLMQGLNLADYGEACCMTFLCSHSEGNDTEHYEKVIALQKKMYELENDKSVLHAHQTGIKLGTGRLLPALNRVFTLGVSEYNRTHGTHLEAPTTYSPYYVSSTLEILANLHTSSNGKEIRVSDALEVFEWADGAEFQVTADRAFTLAGLDFDFGVPDQAQNFTLEVLSPEGEWKAVSLCYYGEGETVVHTGDELNGMQGTAIRLRNTSGAAQNVYFKRFRFVMR